MNAPLVLLLLSAPADVASTQLPACVETPYSLIDAETKYVWYDRTGDTSRSFRLPENSAR